MSILLAGIIGLVLGFLGGRYMAVDVGPLFANLDKEIAAVPARVAALLAAQQANQIQSADVQAAADARAAQVAAIAPAPLA